MIRILRGMDTFSRETTFKATLKGKNFLPLGANSFLLEKTPFQKVFVVQESKIGRKSTKYIKCPGFFCLLWAFLFIRRNTDYNTDLQVGDPAHTA